MIQQVSIARVSDGLPLVASLEENEAELASYKQQAKQLFRKLGGDPSAPTRCSLVTDKNKVFHYIIESGVCYLALCDSNFSKKLAFGFLEELHNEFQELYGSKVATAARPYAFIEFDNRMQRLKRTYEDSRAATRNLGKVNAELSDVQRIMMKNIDDVLDRGEKLDSLGDKTTLLKGQAQRYRQQAEQLKWKALLRQWAPVLASSFIVLVFLYFYFGL